MENPIASPPQMLSVYKSAVNLFMRHYRAETLLGRQKVIQNSYDTSSKVYPTVRAEILVGTMRKITPHTEHTMLRDVRNVTCI